jgi:toxin ParE1/3/4
MNVVWRKRAERAYLAQLAYVRTRDQRAAERLQRIVEYRVDLLARHPEMGRPSKRRGVRELVISDTPYVAIYQVSSGLITILQFFHSSQNR